MKPTTFTILLVLVGLSGIYKIINTWCSVSQVNNALSPSSAWTSSVNIEQCGLAVAPLYYTVRVRAQNEIFPFVTETIVFEAADSSNEMSLPKVNWSDSQTLRIRYCLPIGEDDTAMRLKSYHNLQIRYDVTPCIP